MSNNTAASFYDDARAAVARFAREIALLPSFPSDAPIPESALGVHGPVVKVAATNKVRGQVLPRTEDAWLALRPFQDITGVTLPAWRAALLERRMTALALLVRLSASPRFGWNTMMDCGGVSTDPKDPRRSFWLDLLREVGDNGPPDRAMEMERNLVALSRSPSPRFLLCVDSDLSQVDLGELLNQFFWANITDVISGGDRKNVIHELFKTCGLSREPIAERVIDIGLSFTTGKITHAMVSGLFDVLDRLQSSERRDDGIRFRITALRFGGGCAVQPKAMETLAERWGPQYALTHIALGSIDGVKPASVQPWLEAVASQSSPSLQRLAISAGESFGAFASVFRCGASGAIDEVDVWYDPTEENAAWLAFAFFHVDSQSSVSSVCLRTAEERAVLSDEWIDAFERALQSPTASEGLVGEDETSDECVRTFPTVKATTPVKSHAYSGAKLLCKVGTDATRAGPEYEQIATVKKLIGVVIPGIGVGWVPAASVTTTRAIPSTVEHEHPARTNGRMKSLSIDRPALPQLTAERRELTANVLRLIALVGAPLERLALPNWGFERDHLATILRSWPNLKELNLSGHCITNIAPLVDAYSAGQCQIASLSLSQPLLLTNHDDIAEQLTELLNTKTTGLPLRRLVMHVISHRAASVPAPKVTTQIAEKLALALSAATELSFVQLTALTPSTVGKAFLLDPLPLDFSARPSSQPLAIERKLAFLSALQRRSEKAQGDTGSVWGRLDTLALSLILAFSRDAVACHALRCL